MRHRRHRPKALANIVPYLDEMARWPRLNWRRPSRYERIDNLLRNTIALFIENQMRAELRAVERVVGVR
jgi:hypothetical protein